MTARIVCGDCLDVLKTLPDQSVNCCVTSPPYWGLRDYGIDGQIGLEETPEAYVSRLVEVFREVRRVLKDDGTAWINLGDSYAATSGPNTSKKNTGQQAVLDAGGMSLRSQVPPPGLKPKDLVGIPWRVAFALQADGWYLRSEIIWAKKTCMPESVRDRPTKSHEQIFLLSKLPRYYYDADAIREPFSERSGGYQSRRAQGLPDTAAHSKCAQMADRNDSIRAAIVCRPNNPAGRNRRDVWTVATKPFTGCHFATFPPDLIRPCVRAGCPAGGAVLDPFAGAGTTGLVALEEGRDFLGIELNPEYVGLIEKRLAPLLEVRTLDTFTGTGAEA